MARAGSAERERDKRVVLGWLLAAGLCAGCATQPSWAQLFARALPEPPKLKRVNLSPEEYVLVDETSTAFMQRVVERQLSQVLPVEQFAINAAGRPGQVRLLVVQEHPPVGVTLETYNAVYVSQLDAILVDAQLVRDTQAHASPDPERSILTFMLFHELGHRHEKHQGQLAYDAAKVLATLESQKEELEADTYAIAHYFVLEGTSEVALREELETVTMDGLLRFLTRYLDALHQDGSHPSFLRRILNVYDVVAAKPLPAEVASAYRQQRELLAALFQELASAYRGRILLPSWESDTLVIGSVDGNHHEALVSMGLCGGAVSILTGWGRVYLLEPRELQQVSAQGTALGAPVFKSPDFGLNIGHVYCVGAKRFLMGSISRFENSWGLETLELASQSYRRIRALAVPSMWTQASPLYGDAVIVLTESSKAGDYVFYRNSLLEEKSTRWKELRLRQLDGKRPVMAAIVLRKHSALFVSHEGQGYRALEYDYQTEGVSQVFVGAEEALIAWLRSQGLHVVEQSAAPGTAFHLLDLSPEERFRQGALEPPAAGDCEVSRLGRLIQAGRMIFGRMASRQPPAQVLRSSTNTVMLEPQSCRVLVGSQWDFNQNYVLVFDVSRRPAPSH